MVSHYPSAPPNVWWISAVIWYLIYIQKAWRASVGNTIVFQGRGCGLIGMMEKEGWVEEGQQKSKQAREM